MKLRWVVVHFGNFVAVARLLVAVRQTFHYAVVAIATFQNIGNINNLTILLAGRF